MTTPTEASAYVTSTPNGSIAGSIVSSDVSSLSGKEAPSSSSNTLVGSTASVAKRQNVSELVRNLSLSEAESSDTETEQLLPKPADKKDRQAFMPTDKQRCYYRVIADEENVEDVAHHWINLYRRDEQNSMVFIIQFFLDVASYQTFDASKWYNVNLNEIRKQMEREENCPDVIPVRLKHNTTFATNRSLLNGTSDSNFILSSINLASKSDLLELQLYIDDKIKLESEVPF